MPQKIIIQDLGIARYADTWQYQEQLLTNNLEQKKMLRNGNLNADTQHYLLLVEHPPVYTLGKSGDEKNLLLNRNELTEKGIEYFKINRGGDITFHGPGQLVAYPILDLEKYYTDIGLYLRNLEQVIINVMQLYNLKGERSKGETGVWLDTQIPNKARKICAMGVRCSRWITMHGLAFNVNTDLSYFNNIIPCGISDKGVTSLKKELNKTVEMSQIKQDFIKEFLKVFDSEENIF